MTIAGNSMVIVTKACGAWTTLVSAATTSFANGVPYISCSGTSKASDAAREMGRNSRNASPGALCEQQRSVTKKERSTAAL